ncbi:MAG: plasminogen-binding N-terminal domain-containing protein [Candidatus Marinarcus sp.]|uniref:plasminogen-binding N-terminal domain-containing protein n=1 Tax=Candidatus Marinarcus sp. TaxID=3100987 RepID=UPI003B00F1F7
MKTKLLLLCALLIATILNATETTCYKKDWLSPSTIETVALEGGECKSQNSIEQMKQNGWHIKDIQIASSQKGLNYTYILTDVKPAVSPYVNARDEVKIPSFDIQYTKISAVSNNTATIHLPNLRTGQSGIVVHTYPNGRSVIVANAFVASSNATTSTLTLSKFDDLKQNAIPTTSKKAQEGDTLILNYLYDASLLIAPTSDSFNVVREKFKKHNFLHSDIFATHLKVENEPLPSKETFIQFAKFQNIGTIFFVLNNKVYVVDAKTFNVLESYKIIYANNEEQLPFYTRVAEIDKAFWDIDFSGYIDMLKSFVSPKEKTEEDYLNDSLNIKDEKTQQVHYDAYYKNLLGIK